MFGGISVFNTTDRPQLPWTFAGIFRSKLERTFVANKKFLQSLQEVDILLGFKATTSPINELVKPGLQATYDNFVPFVTCNKLGCL